MASADDRGHLTTAEVQLDLLEMVGMVGLRLPCRPETVTGGSATGMIIAPCARRPLEAHLAACGPEIGVETGMRAGIEAGHEPHPADTEVRHHGAIWTMIWICLVDRPTKSQTSRFLFSVKGCLGEHIFLPITTCG
jgi:hypothetical protein